MSPIPELEAIRRAQILEAGLKVLTRKGTAGTTQDDICRAAGLSKGGLVHYYKSKRILFSAVFEEFFTRIFKMSADTMAEFTDPLDKILSYDWLYDQDNPETGLGYPLLLDLMSLAAHDEEYRAMMEQWINNWVKLLSSALSLGIARGIFREMDVIDVARSISAIYQGTATRWYLGGDSHSRQWAVDTYKKGIMGILSPYMK
ncbi:MAG: TetR/AcrR family transcriptional regulator [Deltaproteobacteria bacterium]|nr:TetR/AcrR family transcriptional regulator [Deltaproteobacteria bacterium]